MTRTFKIRIGLHNPPEAMRLGSTVVGSMQLGGAGAIEIPASALTQSNRQPAVWVVDRATSTVALRNIDLERYDLARVVVAQGLEPEDLSSQRACRRFDRDRRSASWAPPWSDTMSGFNLSEWSIRNRSLVIFLMISIVVAGALAFLKLGRAEDPVFTIRTMVVQAQWPGATLDETLQQVTERLERTLQQVSNLDRLRSYTIAGTTVIFVDLVGSAKGQAVADTWYEVRKKVADMRHTLPQGLSDPASTMISATRSASSMASPPRDSRTASCATTSKMSARACCSCRTSRRSRSWAIRTSASLSTSRPKRWPGSGSIRAG